VSTILQQPGRIRDRFLRCLCRRVTYKVPVFALRRLVSPLPVFKPAFLDRVVESEDDPSALPALRLLRSVPEDVWAAHLVPPLLRPLREALLAAPATAKRAMLKAAKHRGTRPHQPWKGDKQVRPWLAAAGVEAFYAGVWAVVEGARAEAARQPAYGEQWADSASEKAEEDEDEDYEEEEVEMEYLEGEDGLEEEDDGAGGEGSGDRVGAAALGETSSDSDSDYE
jgi:hypothetical protein